MHLVDIRARRFDAILRLQGAEEFVNGQFRNDATLEGQLRVFPDGFQNFSIPFYEPRNVIRSFRSSLDSIFVAVMGDDVGSVPLQSRVARLNIKGELDATDS
jgi:hypothetical protein